LKLIEIHSIVSNQFDLTIAACLLEPTTKKEFAIHFGDLEKEGKRQRE
jgi:hypothetical protein